MRQLLFSALLWFVISVGVANKGFAALTLTDLNIFQDNRSENDVGTTQGDVFQFGADITGGSAGGTIAGIFTPSGSTTPTLVQTPAICGPLGTNPNFCSRTSPFTPTRLAGTWQVSMSQYGSTVVATLPSTSPIPAQAIAFP
jgi:hypothetical protein